MPPDVMALETALLQAIVDRRWDKLADQLHDDFRITTAGWLAVPATKHEWVEEVAGRHILHSFEVRSVEVQRVGGVCIALVLSTQWATWKNEPFEGDFRYTDVWAPDRLGQWLLAVRHATLAPGA